MVFKIISSLCLITFTSTSVFAQNVTLAEAVAKQHKRYAELELQGTRAVLDEMYQELSRFRAEMLIVKDGNNSVQTQAVHAAAISGLILSYMLISKSKASPEKIRQQLLIATLLADGAANVGRIAFKNLEYSEDKTQTLYPLIALMETLEKMKKTGQGLQGEQIKILEQYATNLGHERIYYDLNKLFRVGSGFGGTVTMIGGGISTSYFLSSKSQIASKIGMFFLGLSLILSTTSALSFEDVDKILNAIDEAQAQILEAKNSLN